jgi:hypothetical protein
MSKSTPQFQAGLIDQLVLLGMSNKEFQDIHHFGKEASIKAHRAYLDEIQSFRGDRHDVLTAKLARKLLDHIEKMPSWAEGTVNE